jgi:hypothetical protein
MYQNLEDKRKRQSYHNGKKIRLIEVFFSSKNFEHSPGVDDKIEKKKQLHMHRKKRSFHKFNKSYFHFCKNLLINMRSTMMIRITIISRFMFDCNRTCC